MEIKITLEEVNALIQHHTENNNILMKSLPKSDSFSIKTVIGLFSMEVQLTFDRIINGNELAFNYKMPLRMNVITNKFGDVLSALIPRQIARLDNGQIIVHLKQIKAIVQYFELFEISHFEISDEVLQLHVKPKSKEG